MNERDLQLVRAIDSEIQFDSGAPVFLLSAKYTNLVRVNLVLLKAFLDEKHKRGVIITIDRPHQYISHLLQLHGIDQTNLTYIDAISAHSSDTKGGSVATEFQRGPFHIETLPDFLFSDDDSARRGMVDMSKVEFVVIDNVSTLLTYNSMDSVRKFFSRYVELAGRRKSPPLVTALVMDRELFVELFGILSGLSKKVMDVGPDMTIRQLSGPEPSAPQPQPMAPPSADLSHPDTSIVRNKGVM